MHREKLMSSGIGLGLAIPHTRIEGIRKPIMAIGVSRRGIPDYESIDDKNIWIVIMVAAGKNQHREYIRLTAWIIQKMKNGNTIEKLLNAKNCEEIYNVFIEQERCLN